MLSSDEFFHIWLWTLICDLDHRTWTRQCEDEPSWSIAAFYIHNQTPRLRLLYSATWRHESESGYDNRSAITGVWFSRRPASVANGYLFLHSTIFIGLDHKFLDNGSQASLNGSPRNLHTSLVWGQALKPTFEFFLPHPKNLSAKNIKVRRPAVNGSAQLRNGSTYRPTKIIFHL